MLVINLLGHRFYDEAHTFIAVQASPLKPSHFKRE